MIPLSTYLAVWSIFLVNLISPGPNVLNTIATAMGSGRRSGIAAAMAVAIGVSIWCLAAVLGLGALFAIMPGAQSALTLVGAALLLWFAQRYARAAFSAHHRVSGRHGISPRAAFLGSLGILLTNPKALTTWLVVLSLYPVAEAGFLDVFVLLIGTITIAVGVHLIYALVFSTAPAAALYLRAAPVINAGVAVLFLAVAIKLIWGLLRL